MSKSGKYENLIVWSRSVDLSAKLFITTGKFPREEIGGIIRQIRNASVSIPSNIAEGSGRDSDKEFIRFLNISSGSVNEVKTQLLIANKIGFLSRKDYTDFSNELNEIGKMLTALKKSLKAKD